MKKHERAGREKLLVSIDIGTTKISVLAATRNAAGLQLLSIGQVPALGMCRGIVIDIAQAVQSIRNALQAARREANVPLKEGAVGISGSHIQTKHIVIKLPIKGLIHGHDVEHALAKARAGEVSAGHQVLHAIPQRYYLDDRELVSDPVGMLATWLTVHVMVVSGSVVHVQNLIRCCQLAGFDVTDIILEPIASAEAVLSRDEKELGVAVLDIGGGTSDLIVYQKNVVRYAKVLAVAGNHITKDIALCLRTSMREAERTKHEFGAAFITSDAENGTFEIESVEGNKFTQIEKWQLIEVIEPRVAELLTMVSHDIERYQLRHMMPTGLVITGGGSLLKMIKDKAEYMLDVPVRVGYPTCGKPSQLQSPVYATGYGLLIMRRAHEMRLSPTIMSRVYRRMKTWVQHFF